MFINSALQLEPTGSWALPFRHRVLTATLQPDLTLLSSDGTVIESGTSGTGLFGDATDPYIFAGLNPGTYTIEVSAAPSPQGPGVTPTGGTFDLSLLAQPHTNPTQLVSFSINNADPNDPSPTSISLSFSGPINVNSVINLTSPDLQETGLQVVDSSGKEWPITTLEYEATSAQLTMVFNEPLPAGQYRLIVPSRGGLTDLAGLPVSAPDEPAGVLASWSVAVTSNGPKGPTDLGVLWPAVGGNLSASASSEFVENTSLTPDQPVSYRWVVTVPGMYALQTQSGGSDIEIVNVGNGKTDLIDAGSTGSLNTYLMANLSTGTYELTFLQQGQSASLVRWTLKCDISRLGCRARQWCQCLIRA